MINALSGGLEVPCVRSGAERLPFADACFDVVTVGQAFHWFDTAAAVPEIARVLAAGGALTMIWNFRDERTDWSRQLSDIIGSENFGPAQPRGIDWLTSTELGTGDSFGEIEQRDFQFTQQLDRDGLLGLVASRSYVAALDDDERDDVLDRVGRLYDATVKGAEQLALPYVTECYRTRLTPAATG
jgi:SAM-dependent methyltransferase